MIAIVPDGHCMNLGKGHWWAPQWWLLSVKLNLKKKKESETASLWSYSRWINPKMLESIPTCMILVHGMQLYEPPPTWAAPAGTIWNFLADLLGFYSTPTNLFQSKNWAAGKHLECTYSNALNKKRWGNWGSPFCKQGHRKCTSSD